MRILSILIRKCLLVLSLSWPITVCAQLQLISHELAIDHIVEHISIQGLERTQPAVVYRELLVQEQMPLSVNQLSKSVQRLKNLRLFSAVNAKVYIQDNKKLTVVFELTEKWTTIPIFKITQGGGTRYLVLGTYDINTFGRYLETGVQYENWNGESGGVVWFREPRLMNQRMRFGADLWLVKRPRDLFLADGTEQGSFVLEQQKLNLFTDKEFTDHFTLGLGLEFTQDSYLAVDIGSTVDQDTERQLRGDSDSSWAIGRLYLQLGRLHYDNYLLQGGVSEVQLSHTVFDSEEDFYRIDWDNRYFLRLPHDANLGMRLRLGTTDGERLQHLYYVGGFEHIRGYSDGQFRGQEYWQANLEYRLPSYKWPWIVLQHNLFVDVSRVTQPFDKTDSKADDLHYSWGIGLRIISPKIYRFIGRFDFALDTSSKANNRISFGVQQFF